MFSGELPSSLKNLSRLETMDAGNNLLSGNIPSWLGGGFNNLRILKLNSNKFGGRLPPELSSLSSLQVLDLAENNLTSTIPPDFGSFKAMAQEHMTNLYLLYGAYRGQYYEESLVVNIKGQNQKFTKILSLVTSMDLSSNNLYGDFPVELTKLSGLVVLNLSRNRISGQIPDNISNMHELSSLDLSSNKLSGAIPPGMSSLSFLSDLNLSNNNLSGMIPNGGQLQTFPESAFAGNPGLCGVILPVQCQTVGDSGGRQTDDEDDDTEDDAFINQWFYLSLGLGFAAGLLVPYLIISIRKPWSSAYFNFVDKVVHAVSGFKNEDIIKSPRSQHFQKPKK